MNELLLTDEELNNLKAFIMRVQLSTAEAVPMAILLNKLNTAKKQVVEAKNADN